MKRLLLALGLFASACHAQYYKPVSLTAIAPDGKPHYLGVDSSGNFFTSGSPKLLAQADIGYTAPVQMYGMSTAGLPVPLKVDALGNLLTAGTSSGGTTITCSTLNGVVYYSGTGYVCGIIDPSMLPLPTLTAKGGVFASNAVASQWVTGLGTNGQFSLSQPNFSDLAGTATPAQVPLAANSTLTGSTPDNGITLTRTATGVMISGPNVSPVYYTTVPTFTPTTKHYVSFSTGNDSNNGLTPATAWKNLSKVNSYACTGGDAIYFYSEDVWSAQSLTVNCSGTSLTNPVYFGAYGPLGILPTFDAADPITSTAWTVQSGNTYQAPYTNTVVKGFVDSLRKETVPLALQTSVANVNSTAGSIYSDGTNVYVHLLDNSSPATHTIEVSSTTRRYGIFMADRKYVVIDGLRAIRSAGGCIVSVLNADNSSTQFNAYNTIENSEVYNCDSTQLDTNVYTGGGIVVRGRDNSTAAGMLGWNIVHNKVGRIDKEFNINDDKGGYQITGTVAAVVADNYGATTNAMCIQSRKYFSGTQSSRNLFLNNTCTNSEGGIRAAGPGTTLAAGLGDYLVNNTVTHSRGFGLQAGSGGTVVNNTLFDLARSTDATLYNGIDENQQPNVYIYGNKVSQVWGCSLTLEQASPNATVTNNILDATMNMGNTNTPGEQNCALFEMSGSTPGLTFQGNTFMTTPLHPNDSVYNVPNYSGGNYVTGTTLNALNTVALPTAGARINNLAANNLLDVDSVVATTAFGMLTFGDSITNGQGPLTSPYVTRIASDYSLPIATTGTAYVQPVTIPMMYNYGISGSAMCDQTAYMMGTAAYSPADTGNPIVSLAVGTNNTGTGTPNASYTSCGFAFGAWAASSSTTKFLPTAFTQTSGTWTQDTGWSTATAMTTSAAGTLTFNNPVISKAGVFYVMFKQDVNAQGSATATGSFQVSVDGGPALTNTLTGLTTVTLYGTGGSSSPVNASIARFVTTPSTTVSTHSSIAITWLSGKLSILPVIIPTSRRTRGLSGPRVVIGGVIPQQNDANAAATLAFNNGNLAISKLLVADGLNAPFVDLYNNMDPVIDMTPSGNPGLHPGDKGAVDEASLFEAAIGAPKPVYVPNANQQPYYSGAAGTTTLAPNPDNRSWPSTGTLFPPSTTCANASQYQAGCNTALDYDGYLIGQGAVGNNNYYISYPGQNATVADVIAARVQRFNKNGSFNLGAGVSGDANGVVTTKGFISTPETINVTSGSTTVTLSGNTEYSYIFLNNASATAVTIPQPVLADFGKRKVLQICASFNPVTFPTTITNMVGVMDVTRNGLFQQSNCAIQSFRAGNSSSLGQYIWIAENEGWVSPARQTSAIPTIASATTITPTAYILNVSGTAAISTVTLPSGCTTSGRLCEITIFPTGTFTTVTGGNIGLASTSVVGRVLKLTWNFGTSLWYPSY